MVDKASRRGAVDAGMVLMVVAFATMGGFIFWLTGQAAAERELTIVEDTVPVDEFATAATVSADDIRLDATPFEGQLIRLAAFDAETTLGTQGFWLAVPNGNPFLVSMSAEVIAEGIAVARGSSVTVTGTVYAMNDSTLTAWTEAGAIQEGDRIVAEFATHYLEAVQVVVRGGGGGDGN